MSTPSRPNNASGSLPRRRNGKEQACEPCRKAKIACDHSLPTCTRCKRRKLQNKCVYMSAPMTRVADPSSSISRRQSEPIHSQSQNASFPLTPTTGSSAVVSPISTTGNHASIPSYSISQNSTAPPRPKISKDKHNSSTTLSTKVGFFGPTSFSAVFAENRENLGGNDDIPITNEREPYISPDESLSASMYLLLAGKTSPEGREPRLLLGARILQSLPDQCNCNFLLEWYFEKSNDPKSYKRLTMAVNNSLWSKFGKELKEPRTMENLEKISAVMCKNVYLPLEESDDWDTWISSITGDNMRWEAVGSVYGGLCSALLSLGERDAFFTTQRSARMDRKHFAYEMKDCLQACIGSSNYMDLLNILMVAILCKNTTLQTVLSGDTKSASLLTGRPPALSYRYTRFELPLDLDDDVTIKGGAELEKAIAALDKNGWNTDGQIYPSTLARGRGQLAIVLNEVLELSLGDGDVTAERIAHIIERLENTYNAFPECLKLQVHNDPGPDIAFISRLCVRLDMLEHRLILERLAYKQNLKDGQAMIDCAREMLELVVLIWVQRDRFVEKHCDYDWMLMCWGVPSSGVLCVELLKQTKLPIGSQPTLKLPRSEIVQNLSLLIGFLEWVRPAAGNYLLCRRMSMLIKRILEQILNPSPPSSNPHNNNPPAPSQESIQTDGHSGFDVASTTSGVVSVPGMNFDPVHFEQIGNWEDGLGDLDWLNTVDWSRGPWRLDVGGQDFSAGRWN